MIVFFNGNNLHGYTLGAKGARLSSMYKAGIPVPFGFVITAEAYSAYVVNNELSHSIEEILKTDRSFHEKSLKIKALFKMDLIPHDLVESIDAAFTKLGANRVAVRSSSTAEDLEGLSFAGQYSTYLGITRQGLIESVLNCWKSLWNESAIAYRQENKFTDSLAHAVIVQDMVEAQVSGVLFTANPISGKRSEYVINSAYGIGEGIVSGEVMPDEYVYAMPDKVLVRENISKKHLEYIYSEHGVKVIEIQEQRQKRASLTSDMIDQVLDLGTQVAEHFSDPQDIEFAVRADGRVFITQARDITTLFPVKAFDQDGKLRAYLAASSVLLGMKEPFTPLGADVYGGMFPKVLQVMTHSKRKISGDFVKYAAARIYLDISYMLSNNFVAKQFASAFSGNDLPLKGTMDKLRQDHGKTFTHQGISFKIPWGLFRYSIFMIGPMREASKYKGKEKYERLKALGAEEIDRLQALGKTKKTFVEKLHFCDEIMLAVFKLSQTQAMYCLEVGGYQKLVRRIEGVSGKAYNLDALSYTLPGCITLEMNRELNELAAYFHEAGLEPTLEHEVFKKFISKYGHRGNVELDFGTKRWREDGTYLLNQVRNYCKDEAYAQNIAEMKMGEEKAHALMNRIYEDARAKKGDRYAKKLLKQMQAYRMAAGMREYPKYNILQGLDIARRLMHGTGQVLTENGLLSQPEDIFYLHKVFLDKHAGHIEAILEGHLTAEIKDFASLKQTISKYVKANRALYEKEMDRTSIPRIVLNNGQVYNSAYMQANDEKVLKGFSLSSGVYEGRIRIVHDPLKSELQPDEILVAESTNPSWTPLFSTAKGLILEYGGPLSHGGIVAREYGIPAVVGISSVSNVFVDGQRVRVNGDEGTVEILEND